MFNSNDCFTMPVIPAYSGGYGAGNGMWGDGGWIWLIVILGLFGGWGGFGGFGRGYGNYANSPDFQGYATRADINEGFAFNGLQRDVDAIQHGICDSTYALTNALNNGFSNAELSRCNQQSALMQQMNNIQFQNQQCCCDTLGAIKDVRYDMATQSCDTRNTIQNVTRDILENNNSNTRAILDFLTKDKIASLQAENQSLKFAASQANQNAVLQAAMDANTAEIIRRTGNDCPIPAYVVPNPNCCYGNPIGVNPYGQYNGCGNGCGC